MQQFINGKKTEINICHDCAHGDESLNLESFFQGLMGSLLAHGIKDAQLVSLGKAGKYSHDEPECPVCTMTYRDFKEKGRLGCEHCYTVFRRNLAHIFNSIQSGSEHKGKIPLRSGAKLNTERQIDKLSRELRIFVEQEEFEKAAALRDEIRRLRSDDNGQNMV